MLDIGCRGTFSFFIGLWTPVEIFVDAPFFVCFLSVTDMYGVPARL